MNRGMEPSRNVEFHFERSDETKLEGIQAGQIYLGGETMKSIICLDFDGVVHSYESGWKGARNIPDPPVEGAINFMLRALDAGYDVVIHSSRARYFGGISAMKSWLKFHANGSWYEHGFGLGLESVRFTRWKPPALVTIDDRAIRFDGTFPDPKMAASMKPWNKAETI